ncbi:MAG: DUF2807 domain-containing protein, partial [Asticcacaulis sp. 32-58-5]
MIRKLFIVAGAGFVLSVACLSGAAALASKDMAAGGWNWSLIEHGDNIRFLKRTTAEAEPSVTRTLEWAGAKALSIDIPAEVVYTQSPNVSVSVTGPKSLAERVRIDAGRLYLVDGADAQNVVNFKWGHDGFNVQTSDGDLKIVISAPEVERFIVSGISDLDIKAYDRPSLELTISGTGDVDAVGRTQALKLDMSGTGDADLEGLRTNDAEVTLSGTT